MSSSRSAQLLMVLVLVFTDCCWGQEANCTLGDLRLYNSSTPGQGMLLQCDSYNQWNAVCNYAWGCKDAEVACRKLGFSDSMSNVLPDGYFGKWDSMPGVYYSCSGSEKSLHECSSIPYIQCNINSYPNRMAGLVCHPPHPECTHGDLRLMGGESQSEGRVEACYKGGWYSVCETNDEDASVMCKQLGHTVYPWASVFTDGRFGQKPLLQGYMKFGCSADFSEDKWTECTVYVSSSLSSCITCIGDAIKCFTPPECEEGNLRLVDGAIDNEGRVEVCLQGVWGTILSSSYWTSIDAYIVCKQLGLGASGKMPEAYTVASKFGDGNQPQVMYELGCNGWESTLTDCSYDPYGSFSPSRTYTAGVLCFDDCKDGEVRLVGGASNSEGTVEVCLAKLWGLVSVSWWSLADAQVVCNQLGFPIDEAQAINKSHYGKPRKPVHLSIVHCTGSEQQILSCNHHEFPTLDDKKNILSHVDVAGVSCQPQKMVTQTTNLTNGTSTSIESSDPPSAVVLLVPTYFTMLMVMAVLILTIVIVAISLRMSKSVETQVGKESSMPMTSQHTCTPRYTTSKQHPAMVGTRYPPQAPSLNKNGDEPMYEVTETNVDSYMHMS